MGPEDLIVSADTGSTTGMEGKLKAGQVTRSAVPQGHGALMSTEYRCDTEYVSLLCILKRLAVHQP